jgi:hypothetical protein
MLCCAALCCAADVPQAGMSVELYEDDVWWKGMVLRKSPAGVFVYLPGECVWLLNLLTSNIFV